MSPVPTKVVFVAGWGRSGSTLLDVLLGQLPGYFSAGEVVYLWSRGILRGWGCGCGATVPACSVWQAILAHGFRDPAPVLARRMAVLERRLIRTRHLPGLVLSRRLGLRDQGGDLAEYRRNLSALYRSIASVTGARAIVDSSKLPMYGAALDEVDGLDLRVVHLIRDPRAVAYSWSTPDKNPGISERVGVTKSSALWTMLNLGVEALWNDDRSRYLQLTYEELVTRPRSTFDRILDFLGEERARTPFTEATRAVVGQTHTVSGNPSRFQTGEIEIRADDRWREAMPEAGKRTASLLTLPLLQRYGYPITPRHA